MNHNKYNLKEGDTVILDKDFNNHSTVEILSIGINSIYAEVIESNGENITPFKVMTNRLTPID